MRKNAITKKCYYQSNSSSISPLLCKLLGMKHKYTVKYARRILKILKITW